MCIPTLCMAGTDVYNEDVAEKVRLKLIFAWLQ